MYLHEKPASRKTTCKMSKIITKRTKSSINSTQIQGVETLLDVFNLWDTLYNVPSIITVVYRGRTGLERAK